MNEQLQSKLVEILAGIQAATKTAGDFAMEQLPDIAQQYVAYGRAFATVNLILAVVFAAGSAFVALRFGYMNSTAVHEKGHYAPGQWKDARVSASIFGTLFGLISLIWILAAAHSAALVWFAPKVWLLKELASLIK